MHGYCSADQRLCFPNMDSTVYFSNPKIQASSHLLLLYSLVCVGLVGNLEDRFSHEAACMIDDHYS